MTMPDLQHPPAKTTLYTCHFGRRHPLLLPHGCRRAHKALDEAGIEYESVILAKGRPRGIGTTGKRPELKRISGQEMLPVLALPDGTTVVREDAIVAWAAEHKAPGSS
jgi:glutathione S-transferase